MAQGTASFRSYRSLLSRYLAPQSGAAAAMGAALLAATGLQLAAPALAGEFIDAATAGAAAAHLLRIALLFLGAALLAAAAQLLATGLSQKVAWRATNALRLDLVRHLLALDPSAHARYLPGELVERVDGDVARLGSVLSGAAVDLLGSALLLLGLIAALWLLQGALGFAFGVFVLATGAALEAMRRRAVPWEKRSRSHSAAFFGLAGEAVDAAEDARTLGATAHLLRRITDRLADWLPVYTRAVLGEYRVWVAALVAFGIGDAIAYAFGARLYLTDALPLGSVYAIVAYAALVAQPLGTLRDRLAELQGADAGLQRVQALLAERSLLTPGAGDLPGGPLGLAFEDVRFAYPDREGKSTGALRGVSFALAPGRRLGLIGRTGAGKSTLVRLAMRLYDPERGCVRVGGRDVRDVRRDALRRAIAYVPQDVQIFRATLRENLTLFDPGVRDDDLARHLESLGLGPWLARQPKGLSSEISPASLSAGEAQLIALARVLRGDPRIVLLDEVSSRLDPSAEQRLGDALDRLLRGRTAIVIAHRPATLARMDDILALEDGEAVEFGPRTALAAAPGSRYRRLLETALEGTD